MTEVTVGGWMHGLVLGLGLLTGAAMGQEIAPGAATPQGVPVPEPGSDAELARWRQLFQRLLSGARRLRLRSGLPAAGGPDASQAKSREIGRTMAEALQALERAPGAGSTGHAAVLATARRCLGDWQAIDRELQAAGPEGGPAGPGTAGPGADERGREQAMLGAERFVTTYGRALQRIVQLLRRGLLKPLKSPIKKKDLPKVRDRVIGGYRQAEARVQVARTAARAGAGVPRAGAGPDPLDRAWRRLQQAWRRVQRDFRIGRKLVQQLHARFESNMGPPCPGGDCPEPEL